MIKRNVRDVEHDIVREPGAKNVTLKRLVDVPDGADRFVMTLFYLAADGSTPPHYHDWEHQVFILKGSMELSLPEENKSVILEQGDAVFIPRNEPHAFLGTGKEDCELLVIAPTERPPIHNHFLSDKPYEFTNGNKG